MYENTARNPHGYVVVNDPDRPTVEGDTLQCCHCGGHFLVRTGSGTKRGWCGHCGAATCGATGCHTCLPLEKWMKQVEDQDRKLRSELGILIV